MSSKEQKTQGQTAGKTVAKKRAEKKMKKKLKIELSFGKILALLFIIIAIIYFSFSVSVFWNFIRIMNSDPDAEGQQKTAKTVVEALDESYAGDDE